jgi:hypothetical protein
MEGVVRLPKWMLCTLWTIIALVGFALPTWWWITWPARTAREFAALISERKFDEANAMMSNGRWSRPYSWKLTLTNLENDCELCNLLYMDWDAWSNNVGSGVRLFTREPDEFLAGRRRFAAGDFPLHFTAARGRVEVLSDPKDQFHVSGNCVIRIVLEDGRFLTRIEAR